MYIIYIHKYIYISSSSRTLDLSFSKILAKIGSNSFKHFWVGGEWNISFLKNFSSIIKPLSPITGEGTL